MTVKGIAGFFSLMIMTLAHALPTDIQIKASIPSDNPCPGNLVVELNLYGKDLREIKGMRCVLDKAVDNTGKNLILKESDYAKTNQTWTPPSMTHRLRRACNSFWIFLRNKLPLSRRSQADWKSSHLSMIPCAC